MVNDQEKIAEHAIQIAFYYSIVRLHVVINIQRRFIGAWILGILAQTTSFKRRVRRDGEVSFISSSRTLNFFVFS
jgi:hypothetical protein